MTYDPQYEAKMRHSAQLVTQRLASCALPSERQMNKVFVGVSVGNMP